MSADLWSQRAQAYRESETHREGPDLELVVDWAEGETALDVATGGGHTANRLREAGFGVTTLDPAPGMGADVVARAEHIPFADGSFDTVVTRIAAHHFEDAEAAVAEMARVARGVVIVVDNLFGGERFEQAEKLRDPTHVRCYAEDEWRAMLGDAGLEVEAVERMERRVPLGPWLERAGCTGDEAERVVELLGDRADRDADTVLLERIALKARKR